MEPVLQKNLPLAPWMEPAGARLPGTGPVAPDAWISVDDAYAGQMRLRDTLISEFRQDVIAILPSAMSSAAALLDEGLALLARTPGFAVGPDAATRPDGVKVPILGEDPLGTLGRLCQEDLCILEKPEGAAEHVLSAAVLCFPAGWTLAEKMGRPLSGIHDPVKEYGPVTHRVQRMFDALKIGRPVRRANALIYDDPTLFAPRRETEGQAMSRNGGYLRSEVQVLFRLSATGAIVFSIHTYVVRRSDLTPDQAAALVRLKSGHIG